MIPDANFEWTEWLVFASITVVILAITLYFSGNKTEHIVRTSMGIFPITMTVVASNISAAAFRGVTEVYQYGLYYAFEFIPILIGMIVCHLQIHVLYRLKLPSINKYFEMRFDRRMTIFTSTILFAGLFVTSVIMCYTFGLFLGQITGLNDVVIVSIIAGVTLVLSTVGGFKGIVWTDTVQCIAILGSLSYLLIVGVRESGGFERVYEEILQSDRFGVDWSFDPTKRSNGWAMTFGYLTIWCGGVSLATPHIYQRFVALPSENHCKWANAISSIVTVIIKLFIVGFGILATVRYKGCDPVTAERAHSYDQILAYFVQDIGGKSRLARSIYLIAYVSAGISTLSTTIHTTAALFYEDYYKRFVHCESKPKHEKRVMVLVQFLVALAWIFSVKLIKLVGNVNDAIVICGSSTYCIYCAIHVMAIFIPFINAKGAFWGGIAGFAISCWIQLNSSKAIAEGFISYPMKEMRTDNCDFNVTIPAVSYVTSSLSHSEVFYLFRISNYFSGAVTFLVVVIVASIISAFCHSHRPPNKELISPLVRRFNLNYVEVPLTSVIP